MNIFTKNSVWKKLIIALLIVILFQTVIAKPVHADVVEFGGKLMSPIMSFFISFCDGIMDLIGRSIMGATSSLYEVQMAQSAWEWIGTLIVAIAAAAAAIALVVLTAGAAAAALAAIGITATVTVGFGTVVTGVVAGLMAATWFNDEVLPDNLYLPMYTYSAEEIFKGNILLFDVNFFGNTPTIQEHTNDDGKVVYYYYLNDQNEEVKTSNQSSIVMLKNTISSWYNALRNICLVLMLSVLVYIGIRMLLSSAANDKSKYKTMLKDWFIGLCLLFLMHYIMAFSVTLVEKLTDVVKTSVDENAYTVIMEDAEGKLEEAVDGEHLNMPDTIQEEGGKKYLYWPTNLMGSLRLQLQMEQYGAQYIGLAVCFIMLCLLTLYFTIVYLKRVLYMAFLTLISPMVALTYCIDKINDGQAQGFNKWFKEYIFNLLIQPMHLLLYYILITSAFEFASKNVIYSIVALGFMIPAEKLLRSLFGFEKAHTPPALGPAGAMMAASGLTNLLNRGKALGAKAKGGSGSGGDGDNALNAPPSVGARTLFQASLSEDNGNDNNNNDNNVRTEQDNNREELPEVREAPDSILDQYRAEGFGQNSEGHYYNPWTDEYDPDYDPHNDPDYQRFANTPETGEQENQVEEPPRQVEILDEGQPAPETDNEGQDTTDDTPTRFFSRIPIPRQVKRTAGALGAVAASRGKRALRNAPRTIAKGATKGLAGFAVGGAAAAVGVAIGASSGDLNNVWKYGAGAAVAGATVGSSIPDRATNFVNDIKNDPAFDAAYNKGEYKEDAMNDWMKKYRRTEEYEKLRANLQASYGKARAKQMLEKGGEVEQYWRNGITDTNAIKAMHDIQRQNGGLEKVNSVEKAIDTYNAGKLIGNTRHMSKKKIDEHTDSFRDIGRRSNMTEERANQFAEDQMTVIRTLHEKMYDYNSK